MARATGKKRPPSKRRAAAQRSSSKKRASGQRTAADRRGRAPKGRLERVILFTGKGGVGKTTTAASTGLYAADHGKRTLVMSTDSAHSLGDTLEMDLSGRPTEVVSNLWALEIDLQHEIETHWREVEAYLVTFFESQGVDALTAKELAYIPGFELLAGLFQVQRIHEHGKYDVLILDTAPTADTLRLLSIPDAIDWYYRRFFKTFRRAVKVGRGTLGRVSSIPFPTDLVVDTIGTLHERVKDINQILTDPKLSSVRIVVNPEKMVLREAQRTLSYLCLFGFHVDQVVVNKVIPEEVSDPYFRRMKADQSAHLQTIGKEFFGIPILLAPFFRREVLGHKALREYAAALYKEREPLATIDLPPPIQVESLEGGNVRISLHMPYLESEKFDVFARGSEVIVRYGNFKRSLMLPYTLLGRDVKEATYGDRRLLITFGPGVRTAHGADVDEGGIAKAKGGGSIDQEIGL